MTMSRDWTKEELAKASVIMKKQGSLSYPEFCAELEKQGFPIDHEEIKDIIRLIENINQAKRGDADGSR